jgi:hypothetical protein
MIGRGRGRKKPKAESRTRRKRMVGARMKWNVSRETFGARVLRQLRQEKTASRHDEAAQSGRSN